mmetsp:Transcript_15921/g.40380  ORF Transcript_15921/g.40380 Transcript_15921/m.40380 type:complete len:292 (-) Transcript_15921:643-1518(-)
MCSTGATSVTPPTSETSPAPGRRCSSTRSITPSWSPPTRSLWTSSGRRLTPLPRSLSRATSSSAWPWRSATPRAPRSPSSCKRNTARAWPGSATPSTLWCRERSQGRAATRTGRRGASSASSSTRCASTPTTSSSPRATPTPSSTTTTSRPCRTTSSWTGRTGTTSFTSPLQTLCPMSTLSRPSATRASPSSPSAASRRWRTRSPRLSPSRSTACPCGWRTRPIIGTPTSSRRIGTCTLGASLRTRVAWSPAASCCSWARRPLRARTTLTRSGRRTTRACGGSGARSTWGT